MRDADVMRTYRCAMLEMEVLEKQIARMGSSGAPMGAKGARGDTRSTNNAGAAQLQLYEGLCQQLNLQRRELEQIGLQFEAILSTVRDMRLRLILRAYYAMGMTDEEIAGSMNMSTRRINTLRNSFMRSLDLPGAA